MHPNPAFRPAQDDLAALLVREIGFAAIFAGTPDGPRVAHAPVVLADDGSTLQFHLARGNGLSRHLDGAAALAVVQGPDAYVSANWYPDHAAAVPTWNYVAVEMEGTARQLSDAELVTQLDTLSALHEDRIGENPPWSRDKMDRAAFGRLTSAIIGFEMRIVAWRLTIKLSQNKSAEERERVAAGIERTGHSALAHLMRQLGGARESA